MGGWGKQKHQEEPGPWHYTFKGWTGESEAAESPRRVASEEGVVVSTVLSRKPSGREGFKEEAVVGSVLCCEAQ